MKDTSVRIINIAMTHESGSDHSRKVVFCTEDRSSGNPCISSVGDATKYRSGVYSEKDRRSRVLLVQLVALNKTTPSTGPTNPFLLAILQTSPYFDL